MVSVDGEFGAVEVVAPGSQGMQGMNDS